MPNVLFSVDSQGTAPAQLGVCCGARLQGISQDSLLEDSFLAQLCLSSGAQEIWLLAWGAPRPQETVRDPQHGRYLLSAWAILMSRWTEHHLHTRDQQRRRRLGWGSLTGAGLDAHHLWACLSFNISLTDWNLGHPGCFSSFYQFLMPSSRDHL